MWVNNGLHGWGYSEKEYGVSVPKILDSVIRQSRGAKLIWANTTPVRKHGSLATFDEKTARVRQRNQLASEAAAARQIPVNDLCSVVDGHPEYYAEDGVHFQEAGRQALGQQVVRFIRDQMTQVINVT